MAKAAILKAAFTAGELSPRLAGRVDIAKYASGAKQLRNALPRVQGGVRKRAGTQWLLTPANAAGQLIPMVNSVSTPFVISIASGRLHVLNFYDSAAYNTVMPVTFTGNGKIRYASGGNTLFLVNGENPPVRAVFGSGTVAFQSGLNFIEVAPWESAPAEDVGERQNATITVSGSPPAATLTASANAFRASDVGRFYEDGTGRVRITAFTSATVVSGTIEATLQSSSIVAANTWKLTGPPITTCTPSATGPIGASITLTAGANTWKDGTFATSHVGAFVEINGGLVEITSITSATVAAGTVRQTLSSTTAAPARSWRLLFNPWNAIDGYPQAVALHQQRLYMAGTPTQPQTIWATNLAEYYNFAAGTTDDAGFSFEIASDSYDPIRHLVPAGEMMVFTRGSEFVLRGGVEAPISATNVQIKPQSSYGTDDVRPTRIGREVLFAQRHGKRVRALTYDAASDGYQSPDMSVLAEHLFRDSAVKAWAFQQSPDPTLWMVRNDNKIVSLSYDRDQDVFAYALHELAGVNSVSGIACVPVNGEDQVVLSTVRNGDPCFERLLEGNYLDCMVTVSRSNPNRLTTGGFFETDLGSTVRLTFTNPHGYSNGDLMYCTGGGLGIPSGEYTVTVTSLTELEITAIGTSGGGLIVYRKQTSFDIATTPPAFGLWTGWGSGAGTANALDGKTVQAFYRPVPGSGPWLKYPGTVSVAAGVITTSTPVYELRVGLPFTTTVQTLPPEVGSAEGTAQGQAVSVSEVVVRLLDSCGGTVKGAGNPVALPNPLEDDAAADPFTGDFAISTMGWGQNVRGGGWDGTITLEHSEPSPFEVLAIVQKLTVNAG